MNYSRPLQVVQQVFEAESAEAAEVFFDTNAVACSWEQPGVEISGFSAINEKLFLPSEAAFPNSSFDIRHMVEKDQLVFVDALFHGVFDSEYHGVPPHGRPVVWPIRDIFQVRKGKITHMWFGSDTLEVARQLGVVGKNTRLFC